MSLRVLTGAELGELAGLLERDEFFWLDLEHPTAEAMHEVGEVLGLHPLALEDSLEFGQRPKYDPYEDQALLVWFGAQTGAAEIDVRPIEVHLHLSGSFVVTVHHSPTPALDTLRGRVRDSGLPEDAVVYRILDTLTDTLLEAVERVEERIDRLEGEVLTQPRRSHLERIYRLKQAVSDLQRRAAAQREVFRTASEAISALPGLEKGSNVYLRDVADHLVQAVGELQRQSSDLATLTTTFFNANSDRLNAASERLAVLASIFIPLTLITGFFGQNFGWFVDAIDSRTDFFVFGLGIPAVTVVVVLVLVRRLTGRR